jgi:hypothetical protein
MLPDLQLNDTLRLRKPHRPGMLQMQTPGPFDPPRTLAAAENRPSKKRKE